MNKEKIEELKKKYPEGIYKGEISFTDEENNFHKVEFVYRKPTMADAESHTKSAQKNPIVASINLVQSLIVYPEPGPVMEEFQKYPAAAGRFVDEAISPFFGANVLTQTEKL